MNIKHIPIPFDELHLFQEEDKYQNYLVETLIYSTKVIIHRANTKHKFLFVLTKRHLYAEEEARPKNRIALPLPSITAVIKCEDHPEIVLCTDDDHDNLRISANSEDRCHNIISALAFYFTYLAPQSPKLTLYLIRQNSLPYFERTSKEKRTAPKLNLDRYQTLHLAYLEPQDSPDLIGKLLIQKMQLAKLINSEGAHLLHLARVNEGEEYLCHTLDHAPALTTRLRHHQSLPFVAKLLYARELEYKTQLFFEPMPSLRPNSLPLHHLFQQLLPLYDSVKAVDPELYLSPAMLCLQNELSGKVFLREFRYKELRFDDSYQRFLYSRRAHEKDERERFENKIYNIGMLLYYFLLGRALFDHDDLEVAAYLKENTQHVPFPTHTAAVYSKKTRLFIESCILCRFQNQQAMLDHPWIAENAK